MAVWNHAAKCISDQHNFQFGGIPYWIYNAKLALSSECNLSSISNSITIRHRCDSTPYRTMSVTRRRDSDFHRSY